MNIHTPILAARQSEALDGALVGPRRAQPFLGVSSLNLPVVSKPPAFSRKRDWLVVASSPEIVHAFEMERILHAVAHHFGISIREMQSQRRDKLAVTARQAFFVLGRERTHRSLPQLGQRVNRDHTSVLHSIRTAPQRPGLSEAINQIKFKLLSQVAA